jgi:hypothetical protein
MGRNRTVSRPGSTVNHHITKSGYDDLIASRHFDQAVFEGKADEGGRFLDAELVLERGDVVGDGLGAEMETAGDVACGVALGESAEDLPFTRGE